jgi:hypothetical protein
MPAQTQTKLMSWIGWVLTVLIGAFVLLGSAAPKFMNPPFLADAMEKLGWPMDRRILLAVLEAGCTVIFLFPRTSVLGAVLMTGYLGGAVATHVRIHDNPIAPLIVGVCVWLALYLRDPRIRALLPIRRNAQVDGQSHNS